MKIVEFRGHKVRGEVTAMTELVTESLDASQLLQLTFLQQPYKKNKTAETMFSFYIIVALFRKKSDPHHLFDPPRRPAMLLCTSSNTSAV